MTKFGAALAAALAIAGAGRAQVSPPTIPPNIPASAAPAGAEQDALLILARMLRARTDLSWLFLPAEAERINPDADQMAEARSIAALAQVARARGLDRRPATKVALRALETALLAEATRRDLEDGISVEDNDIAEAIGAFPGRYDEYRLSHIFVAVAAAQERGGRSDAQARGRAAELRGRLSAGENFCKLAKDYSDDEATSSDCGELSSMFGKYMADAFFPSVSKMTPGAISEPVRGPDGYHLIRLEERIPATVASSRYMATQDIRERKMPLLIADALRTGGH